MVFFNYATMQMAAKIVYYGPGLCGKTTNLHHIYTKTSPQSRGEMVSLETESDRTLFFDLLPIDVGVIGGFKTRLQLYTVPGQVFYNTTRKLVLKGVDGIVFVVDSQRPMLDANIESFKNLRENLAEIGLNLDDLPVVIQLNKRDLPNAAEGALIAAALDPEGHYDSVESIASNGTGVFETLKLISKLTLRTLRRRMTGDEPVKTTAPPRKLTDVASFRVRGESSPPAARASGTTPPPQPPASAPPRSTPTFTTPVASALTAPIPQQQQRVRAGPAEALDQAERAEEIPPSEDVFVESTPGKTVEAGIGMTAGARVEEPSVEEPEAVPPDAETAGAQPSTQAGHAAAESVAEPEIEFCQSEKLVRPTPEMKHVKVRSSVDIMAELEALRKRATQVPQKAKKEAPVQELSSPAPKPKRDMRHTMVLQANPAIIPEAKTVKVTVSFEKDGQVLDQQEQSLELTDVSDVRSLSLDLKIALE